MTSIDYQFHRAQSRIKTRSVGVRPVSSRPLFQPELASIETKSNLERRHEWERKVYNMEVKA
jgi:hypothetical protein